ncbi:hypothetical protein ACLKA7_007338 [Drosophila subpalustris]
MLSRKREGRQPCTTKQQSNKTKRQTDNQHLNDDSISSGEHSSQLYTELRVPTLSDANTPIAKRTPQ